MRFYQGDKGRLVWDPTIKQIIAEFDERTGEFETDDPKVIDKLVELGYEHDEMEDVITEPTVSEDLETEGKPHMSRIDKPHPIIQAKTTGNKKENPMKRSS